MALRLRDDWQLGGKWIHRWWVGHELEGRRGGSRRMLVGQRIEGFQGRKRGQVGGHLGERCSRRVRGLFE